MSGDILMVSAVLAVAVLPLVAWLWQDRSPGTRVALFVAAGAWMLLAVSLGQAYERAAVLDAEAPGRPVEERSDGYVSSNACQACHPDQHASWYASYHRTMTQVASPESVRAPFDGRLLELGHRYRLERRGDQFWVVTDDPNWGDAGPSAHRMVLVTGSHHQQVYWFETGRGRTIVRLPFFWRIGDERFVPMHSIFLATAGTDLGRPGRWNRVCIRCHATHSVPRLGDFVETDTRVAEFGIACESCHGPGEAHARRYRDPLQRYLAHFGDGPADDIVNPEHLDARGSVEVCGRCHSVHGFPSMEAIDAWSQQGVPFRPGDDLRETFHLFELGQSEEIPAVAFMNEHFPHFFDDRFWPDGTVAIVGREYNGVVASPCFESGQFDCTTCHEMHPSPDDPRETAEWANDQLAPDGNSDAPCLECHAELADDLPLHTRHTTSSSGSRCMNCHMPHTAYGLLQASRMHRVDSPNLATTLATGRPNACNLCHLDQTLSWAARHLETWYDIEAPRFTDPDHEKVAAGALYALRGDAAQRAIVAWHMGWGPAQEASESEWMVPILAQLLRDPYGAVRYVAHRSLRDIRGFEEQPFDYLAPDADRAAVQASVLEQWQRLPRSRRRGFEARSVLLDDAGASDAALLGRLLAARDDRRIYRAE